MERSPATGEGSEGPEVSTDHTAAEVAADGEIRYQKGRSNHLRRTSDPCVLSESSLEEDPLSERSQATPASLTQSGKKKRFGKHLTEQYEVLEQLGSGSFSTVFKCKKRTKPGQSEASAIEPDKVFALKQIDTRRGCEHTPRVIAHEIAMMKLAGKHDNIIHCYDAHLEGPYVNIIIDVFSGGDLIDGLNTHYKVYGRPIVDCQLSHIIRQMAAAIAHIHNLHIVHRDVKGENFLSNMSDLGDPKCRVALADFGSAARLEPGEKLSQRVGTGAFWAPEVLQGEYEFVVDVWALGVTAFVLLEGQLPFEGESEIIRPEGPVYEYRRRPKEDCKDLIRQCLTPDPQKRITAEQAQRHAWLRSNQSSNANQTEQHVKKNIEACCAGVLMLISGLCSCCLEALAGGMEVLMKGDSNRAPGREEALINNDEKLR